MNYLPWYWTAASVDGVVKLVFKPEVSQGEMVLRDAQQVYLVVMVPRYHVLHARL
jgi:hypothetical protein